MTPRFAHCPQIDGAVASHRGYVHNSELVTNYVLLFWAAIEGSWTISNGFWYAVTVYEKILTMSLGPCMRSDRMDWKIDESTNGTLQCEEVKGLRTPFLSNQSHGRLCKWRNFTVFLCLCMRQQWYNKIRQIMWNGSWHWRSKWCMSSRAMLRGSLRSSVCKHPSVYLF